MSTNTVSRQAAMDAQAECSYRGCYVIYLFFNTVSSALFILFHPSPHSPIRLLTIHHLNHFIRQPTSCIFFSAMTATELKRFISILISTLWL